MTSDDPNLSAYQAHLAALSETDEIVEEVRTKGRIAARRRRTLALLREQLEKAVTGLELAEMRHRAAFARHLVVRSRVDIDLNPDSQTQAAPPATGEQHPDTPPTFRDPDAFDDIDEDQPTLDGEDLPK